MRFDLFGEAWNKLTALFVAQADGAGEGSGAIPSARHHHVGDDVTLFQVNQPPGGGLPHTRVHAAQLQRVVVPGRHEGIIVTVWTLS